MVCGWMGRRFAANLTWHLMQPRWLWFGWLWLAVQGASAAPSVEEETSRLFHSLRPVTVEGYQGNAMEPYITRDGRYLMFNNLNQAPENTNLHFAERIDDLKFRYRGEIRGANTEQLEGVPSMDRSGRLYFVSTRSYFQTLETFYSGQFRDGSLRDVKIVKGISRQRAGLLNFDLEIDASGQRLFFVDGVFGTNGPVKADLAIAQRRSDEFARQPNSATLLAKVNTEEALEFAPSVSQDGRMLLFTRLHLNVGGQPRFGNYVAMRKTANEPFDTPRRLVELDGYVEAPTLTPDERAIYVHKKVGDRFVIHRAERAR